MSEEVIQKFVSSIPQSKCAVIIPLYGFWNDSEDQMTAEVLQVALSRLKSKNHLLYFVVVGDWQRTPKAITDVIQGKIMGGNVLNIEVPMHSSYARYISMGLTVAQEETDARFLLVYNPWIMIRDDGVDQILERTNRGDVGIVSGYETKHEIEAKDFDSYKFNLPKEDRDLNLDFLCMTRQFAEIISFDETYKTHFFLSRDWWQSMYVKGFEVITSQFIPVYSFDVDWSLLEDVDDYEEDKQYFQTKWGFLPGIEYGSIKR